MLMFMTSRGSRKTPTDSNDSSHAGEEVHFLPQENIIIHVYRARFMFGAQKRSLWEAKSHPLIQDAVVFPMYLVAGHLTRV